MTLLPKSNLREKGAAAFHPLRLSGKVRGERGEESGWDSPEGDFPASESSGGLKVYAPISLN